MEEQWLYEAITGTYLPLVQMFEGLHRRRRPLPLHRLAVGAAHRDADRRPAQGALRRPPRRAHHARREGARADQARAALPPAGRDVLRTASTRCATPGAATRATWSRPSASCRTRAASRSSPRRPPTPSSRMLDRNWAAMRAQVHTAADLYEKHFGRRPRGMWLGECGYVPGVRRAAARGRHPLLPGRHPRASCSPTGRRSTACTRRSTAPPAWPPSRRDTESSRAGLERQGGLPGRSGTTATSTATSASTCPSTTSARTSTRRGIRMYTGFKYHAITHDKLHDKWVYDPDAARGKAGLHACALPRQPGEAGRSAGRGHGPAAHGGQPLRRRALRPLVVRGADLPQRRLPPAPLRPEARSSPSRPATTSTATPPTRWPRPCALVLGGQGLRRATGCNETNAWTYRHIHVAGERMVELARRQPGAPGSTRRALNQAARELMLAQSCDWTFIMTTGTTVPYATRRFNEHTVRFSRLYDELQRRRGGRACTSTDRSRRKTTSSRQSTTGSTQSWRGPDRGDVRLRLVPRASPRRRRPSSFVSLRGRALRARPAAWRDVAGALPKALRQRGHRRPRGDAALRGHRLERAGAAGGHASRAHVVGHGARRRAAGPAARAATCPSTSSSTTATSIARYLYGPPDEGYADNLERFTFLSRGALELCKALSSSPT